MEDEVDEYYNKHREWYEDSRYHDIMTYIEMSKCLIEDLRTQQNDVYIDEIMQTIEQAENV